MQKTFDQLSITLKNEEATSHFAAKAALALCLQSHLGNSLNLPESIANNIFNSIESASQKITDTTIKDQIQAFLSNTNQSLKAQINLRGELGAGKTCFARSFLRAYGVTGRIKSPSYTLVETYIVSNLYLYHFDFYRFSDAHEWRDAGFDELLAQDAISLIEWPEQAAGTLPQPDLDIYLEYAGNERNATLSAHSTKGQQWLKQLHNLMR